MIQGKSFENGIAGRNNNYNYNNANKRNYTSKAKSLCLLRHTLQFGSLQLHRKQQMRFSFLKLKINLIFNLLTKVNDEINLLLKLLRKLYIQSLLHDGV